MVLNDRYQIHDRMGEGGMALVYRATDQRLGRQVAVKMLRPQYAGDPEFVERFEQEAQSAAGLGHPNIAAVYDTGQDGETHYIVMELLKPFTLHDLIVRSPGGRLSPEDTVRFGGQIAAALAHAHSRGVVHRDIKPHNILFTDDGLVKVTDFGIARALAATSGTATGTILGSPSYISPEQASGAAAGPAADVYSLGVVLYEMLVGEPPYRGEQPVAIAVQHLNSTPVPPSQRVAGIPPALEQVVLQAMARRPEDRFGSADALRLALEASLTSGGWEPTTALPRGAVPAGPVADEAEDEPEPYQRPVPRRALSPGAWVGLVVLVVVAILVGALAGGRREVEPDEPPAPEIEIDATRQLVVPNVVGQDVDRARQLLEEQFRLEQVTPPQLVEVERRDSRSPANEILEQSPAAGASLDEGGVIRVVVSTGTVMVEVPDVTSMTVDRAKTVLQGVDLQLGTTDVANSNEYVADVIMAQSPAAGSKAPEGSAVNLTVSQGPKPVADEPPPAEPVVSDPASDDDAGLGAPPVSLSMSEPRDADGGQRVATVVVSVPSNSIRRAVELRWLEGGTGTAASAVVAGGDMFKEEVKGLAGAVLGVFVDGEQKGKVEY